MCHFCVMSFRGAPIFSWCWLFFGWYSFLGSNSFLRRGVTIVTVYSGFYYRMISHCKDPYYEPIIRMKCHKGVWTFLRKHSDLYTVSLWEAIGRESPTYPSNIRPGPQPRVYDSEFLCIFFWGGWYVGVLLDWHPDAWNSWQTLAAHWSKSVKWFSRIEACPRGSSRESYGVSLGKVGKPYETIEKIGNTSPSP